MGSSLNEGKQYILVGQDSALRTIGQLSTFPMLLHWYEALLPTDLVYSALILEVNCHECASIFVPVLISPFAWYLNSVQTITVSAMKKGYRRAFKESILFTVSRDTIFKSLPQKPPGRNFGDLPTFSADIK